MKIHNKLFAIVLCFALVLGAFPILTYASDVPGMPQNDGIFVIGEGIKISSVLGNENKSDKAHLPGYSSTKPAQIIFSNPGLAGFDDFEFDYYVENIDNFRARNIKVYFNLRKEANVSRSTIDFTSQITKSGWNHIKLSVKPMIYDKTGQSLDDSDINAITIVRFYIDMSAGETGANDAYKIANICATRNVDNIIPDMVKSDGMSVIYEGIKYQGVLGSNALDENYLPGYASTDSVFVSNPQYDTYDYFEFDFYVEDIDNFKSRVSSVKFVAWKNKTKKFEFVNQITKDGWNHIKIKISYDNEDERIYLSEAQQVRFYITMSEGETGADDAYKVANICATKNVSETVPQLPQLDDLFIISSGVEIEGVLGSNSLTGQAHLPGYSSTTPAQVIFTNSELAYYDYFEFDYFVKDIINFNSRNVKLYFNLRIGTKSKETHNITEQITKSGWNHIKIAINLDDDTLNSIDTVRFYMDMNAGETGADDSYKIANICATKAVSEAVPEMPQLDDGYVIAEGVKIEGVLGSNSLTGQAHLPGYSSGTPAQVTFTNSGLAGYSDFEFDFFVDNITNFNARSTKLYMNLRVDNSKAGTRTTIDFQDQITKSGWNHIKISTDLDNETLNTITVVRFYMDINAGVAGATDRYKIANIYAVKGKTVVKNLPCNPIINMGKDQTEVYITWFTYKNSGKLVFNKTEIKPFESSASEDGISYYHRAKVTGLKENTTYKYSVGDSENLLEEFTLKTNDFDNDFSFVHVSDVQLNGDNSYLKNWTNTLSQINKNLPNTSFIVNTGDIADTNKTELYGSYKSPELLTGYITASIHGNHGSTPDSYFDEHFTTPDTYEAYPEYASSDCDYWFSYNSILFINLNTNIEDINYHKNFIKKTISSEANKYTWIIVNCHHSLFGASYHKNEGNVTSFRGSLAPFFSEMGVDMVLSGHDHCYDRSYIMEGTSPNVSSNSFSANTDGGVLYVSAQSASALKFNSAESGAEEYSAKIVESKYGFISYDVTDAAITLTYYSSADMSILDKFTLYKDDGKHTVEPDKNPLKNKNLENVKLDSNGEYTVLFDKAENISLTCSVEIDLGVKNNGLSAITISLIDGNGNAISKNFTDIKVGWNNLSTQISAMTGNAQLGNIVALKIKGNANESFAVDNLFIGHIYLDDEDINCEICGYERNILMDPNKIPSIKNTDYMSVIFEGSRYVGKLGEAALDENYLPGYASKDSIFVSNPQYDTYDYFEFDIYVEDIDNFKARVSSIQFVAWKTKTKKFEFVNQIRKSGWNHIKIKISYSNEDERICLSEAQQVRFYITMSEGSTGANDVYKVANICVSHDIAKIIPELNNKYRTIDSIRGEQYSINLLPGQNLSSANNNFFKLSKNLNTKFAQYIEMDIYVSADVNAGAAFWVSANAENSGIIGKYLLPTDLKAGWNHIIIESSDLIQVQNDFALKGCKFTYVFLDGAFYNANHSTGGSVKIANISVTIDIAVPNDIMRNNVSFFDSDLEFASLDENGVYMFISKNAKDITNTKMIELDVYVEDADMQSIIIEIMDSSGNYAMYEFVGLTTGWNHLAVRISDFIQGAENEENVNLADIYYFTLWGDAKANLVIANAYAADYIEGDANRDGVVDIKDLIRSRKIAMGVTKEGNALAVSGEDYVINSIDLVDLRKLLLGVFN